MSAWFCLIPVELFLLSPMTGRVVNSLGQYTSIILKFTQMGQIIFPFINVKAICLCLSYLTLPMKQIGYQGERLLYAQKPTAQFPFPPVAGTAPFLRS